jgi:hypothetical protein
MIVMSTIHVHLAASKEADKIFKNVSTRLCLNNNKQRLHLLAESRLPVSKEKATETTLPIYETDDPSVIPESFLLVFRTSHIVTAIHWETVQTCCNGLPWITSSGGFAGFSSI